MGARHLLTPDCAFLRLLRAEAQSAQNPPDLRLAKLHSVQPLDNNSNALECPQIGAKAMVGGLLQHGPTHIFKLSLVKFGWPTHTRHSTQCVDTIFIE